ncbi:MAG: cytochrome b/b6 domain-containing protein [Cohaesibacter sp.]|nr:cytochrome b/b6 domain-containing protein [Cohaesibacter sp.]
MKQDKETNASIQRIKLWDPALRLFHWALVVCVISTWYLGRFGPDIMALHFYFGYAILALLAFRLIWGFIGPAPARFSHMIYSPGTLFSYLRCMFKRQPSYWPGHNPLGALAALALLTVLSLQALSGLFVDPDDFINIGPFSHLVSSDWVRFAGQWHHLLSNVLAGLVGLHLAAILFYKYWKGEDLIKAMINGYKEVRERSSRKDG